VAASEQAAAEIAAQLGYPVALKISSPDLLHKTEAGGVVLGVQNEQEARSAYRAILQRVQAYAPGIKTDGVLVTPMARDGVEVILGGRRDEVFGPVIMVGSGGIYTELTRDVTIRVLPLVDGEIARGLRIYPLLTGARGRHESDVNALVASIERVSRFLVEHPEVVELEINPLRVFRKGDGVWALDAVLKISGQ